MCSSILGPIMDENNNYQGDLTDILLRATTTSTSGAAAAAPPPPYGTSTTSTSSHQYHHWQQQPQHYFPPNSDPMSSFSSSSSSVIEDYIIRGSNYSNMMFGDPFSTMRDPFLHELDIIPPPNCYFNTTATSSSGVGGLELEPPPPPTFVASAAPNNTTPPPPPPSVFAHHNHNKVIEDHDIMVRSTSSIRPPCKNIFSNMIQISPNNAKLLPYDSSSSSSSSSSQAMAAAASSSSSPSAAITKPNSGSMLSPNMMMVNANKDCLLDNNNASSLQISSPRNPGLKRRKNQAKKVVCIPAPAVANSRQTGEVVPSDLWAWRKYGQKPIKGSPYPRGYYRCSSSKGCSARKQVERSRTDPNMLVITYTSEHNHPWPTQRNALAGSTRSQPSKNNNNNNAGANSSSSSKNSSEKGGTKTTANKPKDANHQQQEMSSEGNIVSSPVINASVVKEEMEDIEKHLIDESMDDGEFSDGVLIPNYKLSMMMMDGDDQGNNSSNSEDFFAELGEIEADPLNLLFSTQGFNAGGGAGDEQIQRESKVLDPFNIFDWSGGDTTNTNSFEEHNDKGRL